METIVVHKGERLVKVFVNEPEVDLHLVQEEGSYVKIHMLQVSSSASGPQAVNRITVEQTGRECRTELYGLAFIGGEEEVKMETHVRHRVGEGVSNQLFKFVLSGQAKGHFVGDLQIAQDAQQVEAHQTNRNLLLSDEALMRTQPQLEIYADDVQATHGSSTGQLDESAIFYMRQRGLSEAEARRLLVGAFMQDILETIDDEETRDYCTRLIE